MCLRLAAILRNIEEFRAAATLQCICRREIVRWVTRWIICERAATQIQKAVRGFQCRAFTDREARELQQQQFDWEFQENWFYDEAEYSGD